MFSAAALFPGGGVVHSGMRERKTMDPSAQGNDAVVPQDAGAPTTLPLNQTDANQDPQSQAQSQANAGFQKRIDELTARSREFERTALEAQAAVRQSNELLTQVLARPQAQAPAQRQEVAVPEGMDPATAQYMQRMFESALDQRMQPLLRQLGQVQGVTAAQQAQQHAAQFGDKTAHRAAELAQKWQAAGLQGFTPEDAAIYAAGELYREQVRANAATQQSRAGAQGFAQGMDMPGARGAPSVSGQVADAPTPSWADFNSPDYNPVKGEAYLRDRALKSLKR